MTAVTDRDLIKLQSDALALASKQMADIKPILEDAQHKLLAQKREIERMEGALFRAGSAINARDCAKALGIISQALGGQLKILTPSQASDRCRLVIDNDGRKA